MDASTKALMAGEIILLRDRWFQSEEAQQHRAVSSFVDFCVAALLENRHLGVTTADKSRLSEKIS